MAVAIANSATRASDTRTFNGAGCQLEWLLEKVDKANGILPKPKYFYEFGTLGHAMIEASIEGRDEDYLHKIIGDYKANVPEYAMDWHETKNGKKADLVDNLWDVFDRWSLQYDEYYDGWDVYGTEVALTAITKHYNKITSTIDAVLIDDEERVHVIDWKLGTSKSGMDMQLYVYWYLLRKNGIVRDDAWFRGHFHYVTYANPIGFTSSGEYPGDEFVEDYIDFSERNRRDEIYAPNPTWFSCAYCNYKEECPIYAGDPEESWDYIKNIEIEWI